MKRRCGDARNLPFLFLVFPKPVLLDDSTAKNLQVCGMSIAALVQRGRRREHGRARRNGDVRWGAHVAGGGRGVSLTWSVPSHKSKFTNEKNTTSTPDLRRHMAPPHPRFPPLRISPHDASRTERGFVRARKRPSHPSGQFSGPSLFIARRRLARVIHHHQPERHRNGCIKLIHHNTTHPEPKKNMGSALAHRYETSRPSSSSLPSLTQGAKQDQRPVLRSSASFKTRLSKPGARAFTMPAALSPVVVLLASKSTSALASMMRISV